MKLLKEKNVPYASGEESFQIFDQGEGVKGRRYSVINWRGNLEAENPDCGWELFFTTLEDAEKEYNKWNG